MSTVNEPAGSERSRDVTTTDEAPGDRSPAASPEEDAEARGSRAAALLRWGFIAVVLALSAVLFVLRRPDELAAPYLWDEEGKVIARWLTDGWHTAFLPINGNLSVLTTGGIVLAGKVGWSVLPVIDYVMAVGTFVLTGALLLVPRSAFGPLPVRAAMVVYLAVVPVNPEVYGVMLYTFWWTSLWPVAALGWTGRAARWRPVVVGLAGFNSLAAAVLALVYLPLAFYRRSRELAVSGGMLLVALVAQLFAYFGSDRASGTPIQPVAIVEQTAINVTQFVIRPWFDPRPIPVEIEAGIGVVILLALLGAVLTSKERRVREVGVALWAAGILTSGLSAAPVPLITHPVLAGPRYYFLPFAMLGLLLIMLVGQTFTAASWDRLGVVTGMAACVMLTLGLSRLPEAGVLVRHSEHMDWQATTERCADSSRDHVRVPIQFDGVLAHAWHVRLPSESCRVLLGR